MLFGYANFLDMKFEITLIIFSFEQYETKNESSIRWW